MAETQHPGVVFDRLVANGMINEHGEVTGKLLQWNAFLAITEVKRAASRKPIELFRCLKPVFGLPGNATIDIRRDTMVTYLKEGKNIITALWDGRLLMWRQGSTIRLSENGWIIGTVVSDDEDNVGELPEIEQLPESRSPTARG